LIQQTKIRTIK